MVSHYPRMFLEADAFRIIPSQFPPIKLFENLLDPDELDAAYALESLTNDRIQDEVGNLLLVAKEERLVGEASTPIMAAFTHVGVPSRFTKGDFGVYYAGLELLTAVKESVFSRERFLSATDQPPQTITMRCYKCLVKAELVDVRDDEAIHNANSFAAGQALGQQLKNTGEFGILYNSVRYEGGQCIAILRPKALIPPASQQAHFQYIWDGSKITDVLKIEHFT